MNKALQNPGVLALTVFQPGLKECNQGALFQGTLPTGYQRLISEQSQYKQQTKLKLIWALCPRKPATHELTPWGKEKGEKRFKNKLRRVKGWLRSWLHTDCPPPPPWMPERQSLRKKSFPNLVQERSSNLLTYLGSNDRYQELWLYWGRRWLWFMHKIKWVLLKKKNSEML